MYGKVSMTFRRMWRRFLQYTSTLSVDVEKQKHKKMFSPRGAAKSSPELTRTSRTKTTFHRVARGKATTIHVWGPANRQVSMDVLNFRSYVTTVFDQTSILTCPNIVSKTRFLTKVIMTFAAWHGEN